MSEDVVRKGQIRLFACGGAGINIAKKHLEPINEVQETGMAVVSPVYIDTSKSNGKNLPADRTWIFEEMDGSGKIRAENYEEIDRHVRPILLKYPVQDLAIVLSSASGGSGSVIAPSLVSELLETGKRVIVIVIGSVSSYMEIKNTRNTVKSYEGVAQRRQLPVCMAYFENGTAGTRDAVDVSVVELISAISIVFSRENTELDSMDLRNFLEFQRVTGREPRLVGLANYRNGEQEQMNDSNTGNIITVVSILNPGTELDLQFTPDYHAIGYLPDNCDKRITAIAPMSLMTRDNTPSLIVKDMDNRLAALQKAQDARVDRGIVLSGKDSTTKSGIVL